MKQPMQIVLVKDVKNFGKAGDVVKVRPGYGRNYLLPRKLAVLVSPVALEKAKQVRIERKAKEKKMLEELKKELSSLSKIELTFTEKVKEKDNKLYGSVGVAEIVKGIKAKGINVKKSWIILDHPIKELGDYEIQVKPHDDLDESIKIKVEAEKKSKETKKK